MGSRDYSMAKRGNGTKPSRSLVALARQTPVIDRWKVLLLAAYLGVVLLLCKSLASQAYALLLVPMVLLTPARWQI